MSTLLENIIVNLRVFFAKGTHKLLKWFLLALLALTVLDAIVLIDPINHNYTRYEVPCTGYFGHVDVSGLQTIEKDYLVLAYDAKKIKGGEDIKIKNVLVYNKYTKEILSDFYNINYKITKSSNGELYYDSGVISQDEKSCVVYGMPRSIYEAGMSDEVKSLSKIAESINKKVGVR